MKKFTTLSILFISLVFVFPTQASAALNAGIKPGQFLYFLDTASEKVALFLTFSPEKKAQKALDYADERLAEIEAIAEENDSVTIKKAVANYENSMAFATEKSKEVKDKTQAETLFTSITDSSSKNQEVLSAVLIKVPEEAKEVIMQAIEASKNSRDEAMKQVAELKGEVEELKKEIAELKKQVPAPVPTTTSTEKKNNEKPAPSTNNSEIIKDQVQAQIEATLKAKMEQDTIVTKQKTDEQARIDAANTALAKQVAQYTEMNSTQTTVIQRETNLNRVTNNINTTVVQPPQKLIAVVEVVVLSGPRLVTSDITTFRFRIINNSSEIITINGANLEIIPKGGVQILSNTQIDSSGGARYLEKTLLSNIPSSLSGLTMFFENVLNVLPYNKETLDINIYNLGGSFTQGTSLELALLNLHSPSKDVLFENIPLRTEVVRLK